MWTVACACILFPHINSAAAGYSLAQSAWNQVESFSLTFELKRTSEENAVLLQSLDSSLRRPKTDAHVLMTIK